MTATPRQLGRTNEADGQGMGSAGTGAGLLRSGEPGGGAAEPWLAVLRELPRESAGPAFTQRVLARVAAVEAERRPTRARPLVLATLATAAAAALVAVVALRPVPAPSGEPAAPPEPQAALETAGGETPTVATPATAGPDRASSRPLATRSLTSSPSSVRSDPRPVHASASLVQVRAELAELRRRHRQLSAELIDLPETAGDGRPVVFLGGDEGIELVLDLGRATVEPFAVAPARTREGRDFSRSPLF